MFETKTQHHSKLTDDCRNNERLIIPVIKANQILCSSSWNLVLKRQIPHKCRGVSLHGESQWLHHGWNNTTESP